MNECIASARTGDLTFKHDMALFMGVSQESMPALFCQRIADGIRSGRISYSDINRLQLDQPTEIWMVIKGKSKAAATTQAPTTRTSRFRPCNSVTGTFQVPVSQKCPLSGYADQPTEMDTKGRSKPATRAPTSRTSKFRACRGMEGTFQIPASRKCPLSGYAQY
ncbi:hypothetical protein [Mesorhizobium sp. INR15]|uniref:hypothetical protein n=1 Tax=Mesorhizobium sp. INR15 TaxID=2654248 RepID=UPI002156495D|nr:hypothetical protein [Mesorhizobium sp. INR15]